MTEVSSSSLSNPTITNSSSSSSMVPDSPAWKRRRLHNESFAELAKARKKRGGDDSNNPEVVNGGGERLLSASVVMSPLATWKQRRNFARTMWRVQCDREVLRTSGPDSLGEWYGRGVRSGLTHMTDEAEEMLRRLGYDTDDDTAEDTADDDGVDESVGDDKSDRDAKDGDHDGGPDGKGGDRAGTGPAAATEEEGLPPVEDDIISVCVGCNAGLEVV